MRLLETSKHLGSAPHLLGSAPHLLGSAVGKLHGGEGIRVVSTFVAGTGTGATAATAMIHVMRHRLLCRLNVRLTPSLL